MGSSIFRTLVWGVLLITPVSGSADLETPHDRDSKTPHYRDKAVPRVRPHADVGSVVVNAASFENGVSPGALATIFGSDLTSVTGTVIAQTFPLPTILADVSVLVDGVAAPIYSIAFANGEDQISFQVPYDTHTGPGAVQVEVFDGRDRTASIITDSYTEDPGVFAYQANYALAVHSSDGALVGPDDPAFPGEVLVLYVTGLGPLSLQLQDGYPAPSDPLAHTVDPFSVLVDGQDSEVFFSGLAPGFVGLYQINLRVPRNIGSGDLNLEIQSPYASSRIVILPVRY
jgi:minor extracellular serine protease Vpr